MTANWTQLGLKSLRNPSLRNSSIMQRVHCPVMVLRRQLATNVAANNNNDPLYYGELSMKSSELPALSSGTKIFKILEEQISTKRLIETPITASDSTIDFFQRLFPEVTEWNQVAKFSGAEWKQSVIDISVDPRFLGNVHGILILFCFFLSTLLIVKDQR